MYMIYKFLVMTQPMIYIYTRQWREPGKQVSDFDKCIIKSKSCSFFGNIYSPQVIKLIKIQTIKQMQAPPTKQEVNLFLERVSIEVVSYLQCLI